MSFPQGFLPPLKCSAHSDYTPLCFTSIFGSVSLRQQLQPTLYSPGHRCPFPGQPTPALFFFDEAFVANSETSASQRHSKLPTSAAWLHVGFLTLPTLEAEPLCSPSSTGANVDAPWASKADSGASLGSSQTVNGHGMHVPMVCMDASLPMSLNPHRQQQVPVGTKSFSALSEAEGRFIPRRGKMSFLIVDGKVSASGKANASNSTLRKP